MKTTFIPDRPPGSADKRFSYETRSFTMNFVHRPFGCDPVGEAPGSLAQRILPQGQPPVLYCNPGL